MIIIKHNEQNINPIYICCPNGDQIRGTKEKQEKIMSMTHP